MAKTIYDLRNGIGYYYKTSRAINGVTKSLVITL